MQKISTVEILALRAALLHRDEAIDAWSTLLDITDWLELPDPIHRLLPTIAVNLGCHSAQHSAQSPQIQHAARLAGMYRSTWSSNIVRIRTLSPLLDAFDDASVDHRVMKGAAICALTNRWGIRWMSDVDIAIPREDVARCFAMLRALGFTPRFFLRIDERHPPSAIGWADPSGTSVDIHIGGHSGQRGRVINMLLAQPARHVSSQGRTWPIPSPELMAVHTAAHARAGSAPSDHLQTLLDLTVLLPQAQRPRLERDVRACRVRGALAQLETELLSVTEMQAPGSAPRHVLEKTQQAIDDTWQSFVDLRYRLRERSYALTGKAPANLRRWKYRLWTQSGATRTMERFLFRVSGGFLREGALETSRDRRRRIDIPSDLRGKPVQLTVLSSERFERLLFIDGIYVGSHFQKTRHHLTMAPESIEISLRMLGDAPTYEAGDLSISVTRDQGGLQ